MGLCIYYMESHFTKVPPGCILFLLMATDVITVTIYSHYYFSTVLPYTSSKQHHILPQILKCILHYFLIDISSLSIEDQ